MKLTLTKIKTLPIGKKISDGQGLCLTKTAPNKGRWEHRYMINTRARVMALGTYPETVSYTHLTLPTNREV